MPFLLILAIIGGICTAITYGVYRSLKAKLAFPDNRNLSAVQAVNAAKLSTYACGAVSALFLLLSCLTVVGTKQVGVVTAFGAPQGTLSNGLHFKLPWEKVTEFDAAIQTDSSNVTVRLANQSQATVENSIRWRIVPEAADDLYRDYKDFDNVRESLVTRQLNAALNEVFATYDPLKIMDTEGDPNQGAAVDALGEEVQAALSNKVDAQIEVLDVLTPRADFDSATEEKISQYQQAIADTRIASQRKATATQEARSNQILSDSVDNDPNVLVSKCIDTLNAMIKAGQDIPAGFSCWPGGGTGIVIPSK